MVDSCEMQLPGRFRGNAVAEGAFATAGHEDARRLNCAMRQAEDVTPGMLWYGDRQKPKFGRPIWDGAVSGPAAAGLLTTSRRDIRWGGRTRSAISDG